MLSYVMLVAELDSDFFRWGKILLLRKELPPDRIQEIIRNYLN